MGDLLGAYLARATPACDAAGGGVYVLLYTSMRYGGSKVQWLRVGHKLSCRCAAPRNDENGRHGWTVDQVSGLFSEQPEAPAKERRVPRWRFGLVSPVW